MIVHGRAAEYLEGLLDPEEEVAFLDHVPDCAVCQAALADDLQLRDRESLALPAAEPGRRPNVATIVPIASRRRWAPVVALVSGLAVAAAVMLVWQLRRPPVVSEPTIALAPTRSIPTRVSHWMASAYRGYEVSRGAGAREQISSATIGRLERVRDCLGVAAAHVLRGEHVLAGDTYARCPPSAELDADQAGLAVLRGQPEKALRFADRALLQQPDHSTALWNRALALADLGLGLAAAQDFDRVAAIELLGWANEASDRATALRAQLTQLRESYQRLLEAGRKMVAGGPPIPDALARAHAGQSRIYFHHAVRTARTPARLDELRPLAAALEGLSGTELARYLDQATAALTPARLALVDEYAALVSNRQALTDEGFRAWLQRARRAGADDLVFGALDVTQQLASFADEAERLAAATGDPWFELIVIVDRADDARRREHFADTDVLLVRGERRCAEGAATFRCVQIAMERARLEHDRYRLPASREAALDALRGATAVGEWQLRLQALHLIGEVERFRNGFEVARGFYREYAAGDSKCLAQRTLAVLAAEMTFDEHRIDAARQAAARLPDCGEPPGLLALVLENDLLRAGFPLRDRTALLADLAALRARIAAPAVPIVDYLMARADLGVADDAGARLRALVAAALERPRDDTVARKVITAGSTALMVDAGQRAAWSEVVAIAAQVRRIAPPDRCVLVVGSDDFQFVGVAIGRDGVTVGLHERDLAPPSEWLAPAILRDRLAGCEIVDVLATPHWLGIGPVLDSAVAWRYRLGPTRDAVPGSAHRVIVADPRPPAALGLPALMPWSTVSPGAELITGSAATPERLEAAARAATILEIHAHAERTSASDAPALMLSEGRSGWAVTAEAVRAMRLDRAPVVVLADCVGAVPASYAHLSWGLPDAFLTAGARSVIGALTPIPDADATSFFAGVVADIERGDAVTAAVARHRATALQRDPTSWVRHVVVFE